MKPTISAFKASPDKGRGLARDFRVRWALEEVGQPYDVRLETFKELKEPPYLAVHPFGQIPSYEESDLTLFESGAILLHIGEKFPGILPEEPKARARAIMWMFCAVTTVEIPIIERANAMFEKDKSWYEARLPMLDERVNARMKQLSERLGTNDWLDGAFSAGDLLMVHVVRRMESTGLLNAFPSIVAYLERAKARPAYQRAFAAQLAVFEASAK